LLSALGKRVAAIVGPRQSRVQPAEASLGTDDRQTVRVEDIPGLHRLFPDRPRYGALLALEVARRGDGAQALALLDALDANCGPSADSTVARARLLTSQGDHTGAILALGAFPGESRNAATHVLLAENYYLTGRFADADREYARAIELNPHSAPALLSRAATAARLNRLDEAAECARRALRYDPRARDAHGNLHWVYGLANRCDDEERALEGALEFFPDDPEYLVSRAMLRLLRGDFERGWKDFEARLRDLRRYPLRRSLLDKPVWNGEDFADKTLLVFGEQGAGDSVMMARYLRQVKARGGRVVYEVPESLHELLQSAGGVDDWVPLDLDCEPSVPFDLWVPVMSLGRIFDARPGKIPNQVPYLSVPDETREFWRKIVGSDSQPRVGVVWAGNPGHVNDFFRSMPASALAPVLDIAGVSFYSLQLDRRGLASPAGMFDLTEHVITFTDTAALVEQMDLVIAVDTSITHLSGALGRDTWVLLPYRPDWRWLLDRSASPWYPTVTLFRQPRSQDWASVANNVATALVEWRDAQRDSRGSVSTGRAVRAR